LPSTTFKNNRQSVLSQRSDLSGASGDDFHIPIAFDPTPPIPQSPHFGNSSTPRALENSKPKDYFGARQGSGIAQKEGSTARPSKTSSPHIAYQEKGRQPSTEITDPLRRRREGPGSVSSSVHASPLIAQEKAEQDTETPPPVTQTARDTTSQSDQFRLQEAPKTKRSISSQHSKSESTAPRLDSANGVLQPPLNSVAQSVKELKSENEDVTPRASYEYDSPHSPNGISDSPRPMQHPAAGALASLPKRGDSLESGKRSQKIPRKEVNPSANIPQAFSDTAKVNGGKTISKPVNSPQSKSIFDTPSAVQSQFDEATGDKPKESFVAPRAPPPLPAYGSSRSRNESISSEAAKNSEAPNSPALPRYSAGGDFSMEEDLARILGEDSPQDSFLKRVSYSVRHGRSFSDKGGRLSRENRWPRSPINAGAMPMHDLSSPSTGSPGNRDDLAWFKNELRREKLRASERDRKISELEAALESSASIKQVNSELREKRSTMVVLNTQKEIVVRELEVLTEHIAAAKKSGEPLDLGKMNNTVLKEFAESLQKLKDSFAPQIEESIQRRNELVEEISKLTQAKEKSFQEFEQLSSKNAQLADLNNQLVHQIQSLYKTGAGQGNEQITAPNGLGIYAHHKDKSQMSIDSRTMASEVSLPGSNTTLQAEDSEPATATVVQGPHVVNIRKGQPKKTFNWKGKSSNVAKGVTKGLKGAFSSTQQSYTRELQFAETTPYGSTPPGQEYSSLPRNNQEPIKGGFGFFGNQKPAAKPNGTVKNSANESTPSLLPDAATRKVSFNASEDFH
jgi:Rho-type GTPase-activating protein 1/2